MTQLNQKNNKQITMDGEYVAQFLKRHNIVEKDLAQILGVSKEAVMLWIQGERAIPETTARLLVLFTREPELMIEFRSLSGTYTGVRLT